MRRLFLAAAAALAAACADPPPAAPPIAAPDPAVLARGAAVYENQCSFCHQADGQGVPQMQPSLSRTGRVLGDEEMLVRWVLQGSDAFPARETRYENVMPGFDFLDDESIAAVLTYVRSSFGNRAPAIEPATVAAQRRALSGAASPD
jgi:mono/diheme cytochrome c family protein